MGCCCGKPQDHYHVVVKTSGDHSFGSTDADVFLQLHGNDDRTDWMKLDNCFKNDFEKGQLDKFNFKHISTDVQLPSLIKLELRGHKMTSSWACDYVEIKFKGKEEIFPVYDFVDIEQDFVCGKAILRKHVTDHYSYDARIREIERSKSRFQWVSRPGKADIGWGLPRFVNEQDITQGKKHLPNIFRMTNIRQKNLVETGVEAGITLFINIVSDFGKLKTFDDYQKLFKKLQPKHDFPSYLDRWKSDAEFGHQQMNGISPLSFEVCTSLPSNCVITNQDVSSLLDGSTLDTEIKERRIFIADYSSCFQGVNRNKFKDRCLVCPDALCLYHVTTAMNLTPIAIQLSPNDPETVFTPNDREYDWLLAKMYFKVSMGNYHEWYVHFLLTHDVMETVSVALFRCFPRSHPLYKLLRPHLESVSAINAEARAGLIPPSSQANKALAIEGLDMSRHSFKNFHWSTLIVPDEIKKRGLDSEFLPNFYYRDDALKLWNAQEKFVSDIISCYYNEDKDVVEDEELQDWIKDLGTEGFGWQDGNLHGIPECFQTRGELIVFVTTIMFTSSVQHAAVNFPQYEMYKFIPNAPQSMRLPIHKKGEGSLKRIMKSLPNKVMSAIAISIAFTLSSIAPDEKFLGDYGMKLFTEDEVVRIQKDYQDNLIKISEEIKQRNDKCEHPYEWLLPERVPNSIAI